MRSKSSYDLKFLYGVRPKSVKKFQKIVIISNLRKMIFEPHRNHIKKCTIKYEPNIIPENNLIKKKLLKESYNELSRKLGKFIIVNDVIYVFNKIKIISKIVLEKEINEVKYKIIITQTPNNFFGAIFHKTPGNYIIIKKIENVLDQIFLANRDNIILENNIYYNESIYKNNHILNDLILNTFKPRIVVGENSLFYLINNNNIIISKKTILEKLEDIKKLNGNKIDSVYKNKVKSLILGKSIVMKYIYNNQKIIYKRYKIDDISFDRNINNTEFELSIDGTTKNITLKNYYLNKYQYNIRNLDQPILIQYENCKTKDNTKKVKRFLIPEMCFLTGKTEFEKHDLNIINNCTTNLDIGSQININQKIFDSLYSKKQNIINNKSYLSAFELMQQWGLDIIKNLYEVTASKIPFPQIEFFGKSKKVEIKDGIFEQQKVYHATEFNYMNSIIITFKELNQIANKIYVKLKNYAKSIGVIFDEPFLYNIKNINNANILKQLEKIEIYDSIELIIVILDDKRKDLYSILKNYFSCKIGLPSQFIFYKDNNNLEYNFHSCSILNQIIAKTKGEPYKISFNSKFLQENYMFIGIDSKIIKDGIQYSISSSYNKNFNKYYTNIKIRKNNENIFDQLIELATNQYKFANMNKMPNAFIIYIKKNNEKEVFDSLQKEIAEICFAIFNSQKNNIPKITIFTVVKNTNIKFFSKTYKGYEYLEPGIVVDTDIISPKRFEFYLCNTKNKTSSVLFTCVFKHNNDLTIEEYEEVTFNQCFYYYNFNGPISIPAALKYAIMANKFHIKNIKDEVKENLKDKVYFI